MSMKCECCNRRFDANSAEVLCTIPQHAALLYPVESKYALRNKACHLERTATEAFESIMLTYGNGDLCSRLIYNAINREYIRGMTSYYSFWEGSHTDPGPFLAKDGTYIRQFPPLGDTIRDMFDEAAASNRNPWRISDNMRHTREIQSVGCNKGIFCQDHTFQPVKNYMKREVGAVAVWDAATETGEIASAVLVPTTKTIHFSHAAMQLARRTNFNPAAMYSDTWPNKDDYWEQLFPAIEGRLGLFHYEKRILSTLRKGHIDYFEAMSGLLNCLYEYLPEDYEKVLYALKHGLLSADGKHYSMVEISDMQSSKVFRHRYSKYLRKKMIEPETMRQRLQQWFCRYKVTASDGSQPGQGRLDPVKNFTLFTSDTKPAVDNCIDKAIHLADPLPLEQMYDTIQPSPNSKHNLPEYLSRRGKSKLEAFHDKFAHFGNGGMRRSLADALNLAGTARYKPQDSPQKSLPVKNQFGRKEVNSSWMGEGCSILEPIRVGLPEFDGRSCWSR